MPIYLFFFFTAIQQVRVTPKVRGSFPAVMEQWVLHWDHGIQESLFGYICRLTLNHSLGISAGDTSFFFFFFHAVNFPRAKTGTRKASAVSRYHLINASSFTWCPVIKRSFDFPMCELAFTCHTYSVFWFLIGRFFSVKSLRRGGLLSGRTQWQTWHSIRSWILKDLSPPLNLYMWSLSCNRGPPSPGVCHQAGYVSSEHQVASGVKR